MVDIKYWVWLSLCVQPGSKVGDQLLLAYSADAMKIYEADEESLRSVDGLDPQVIPALLDKSLDESEKIIEYCMVNNIGILPYDSPHYPSRLRRIERAPVLLYYRGRLIDFDDQVEIAAVGTRTFTEYGRREAYRICRDMALGGAVIVSGMARGIDSFCHRGALDVGAHTIAVLGCGINKVYPPEHDKLMNEIIEHGTVFSEYRPFTDPIGSNFPIRNRIISGLSLGTLVIEADRKSGALITAKYALRQGRDIFALPGKIGDANSQGTNELIQKGAKMVQGAEDILGEYEFFYPHRISIDKLPKFSRFHLNSIWKKKDEQRKAAEKQAVEKAADTPKQTTNTALVVPTPKPDEKDTAPTDYSSYRLSTDQQAILNAMSFETSITPDSLASDALPVSRILSALTVLEIKGLVQKLPGNKFVKLK
ncbi:MAG: DNA-processing protein DprA [Eubacteriales bacterium]